MTGASVTGVPTTTSAPPARFVLLGADDAGACVDGVCAVPTGAVPTGAVPTGAVPTDALPAVPTDGGSRVS